MPTMPPEPTPEEQANSRSTSAGAPGAVPEAASPASNSAPDAVPAFAPDASPASNSAPDAAPNAFPASASDATPAGADTPAAAAKEKRFDDSSAIVQLVRFTTVGIFTALIDWSLTMLFTHVVGLDRQFAKAIGWVFGTLAAYLLNSKFTFKAAVSAKKATAVFVLYASTFAIQQLMYWITNAPLIALGFEGTVKDTISFVIAQGVATITNFVLQRVLIFKKD